MRWLQLASLGFLSLALVSCGGAKAKSQGPPNPPGAQDYAVHWLAPGGAIDGYRLTLGTQSGLQDQGEIDIPEQAANERPDGSLEYVIRLDRSRDHYLVLRAYNAMGSSPPSNELRLPALGASSATAQSATLAASSGTSSSDGDSIDAIGTPADGSAAIGTGTASAPVADGAAEAPALAPPVDEPLRSLDLNGVDEFLAATATAPLATREGLTLSLWLKAASAGSARRALAGIGSAGSASRVELALTESASGASLELLMENARSGERTLRSAPIASPNDAWWHVAVVFDAASGRASVLSGGVPLADEISADAPEDLLEADALQLSIGAADAAGASAWRGRVGHAAIFDRALRADELAQLVRLGHELDLRANFGAYQGAPALLHYWRLGADAGAIGRDSARGALPLDADAGSVSAANIVHDAPVAQNADERAGAD